MKFLTYLLTIFLLPAFFNLSATIAQENVRKFSIDASGGGSLIYGDIQGNLNYNAQLGVKYSTSRYFGLKANFTAGKLEGDNNRRSFENNYLQYSIRGVFNISQLGNINYYFPKFNLSAYAGVGNVLNNADFVNDRNNDLDNTFNGSFISAPVGANIKYYLSSKLDLFADVNYAHTKSDLLDAYEPARTANRANDGFATFSIGISYKLGSKSETHYDWDIPEDSDRQLKKFKETQRQKIDEIQTKIENLQSRIENNAEKYAEKDKLQKMKKELAALESKMNAELSDLQEDIGDMEGELPSESAKDSDKQAQKTDETKPEPSLNRLSNKRFVNVIGSFKSLEKAKSFANKVDQEGYNPGVLYDFPNQYHYVHVTKNRYLEDARKALKQTKQDFGIEDAWIYFRSADDLERLR